MMGSNRIRSDRPELLDHPRFAGMSDGAIRLWTGLKVCWDDEGRSLGSVGYVAARVYHTRRKSKAAIGRELAELEANGWVNRYQVAGIEYIAVRGWGDPKSETYQYIKAKQPSKLPPPPATPWPKPDAKLDAKLGARPGTTDREREEEKDPEGEVEGNGAGLPAAAGEVASPRSADPDPDPTAPVTSTDGWSPWGS